MSWTEQKIQALKDMWGHGYSASEIAKHLGGLTRNAVIGKAHRLKLSSRPSPIKREDEGTGLAASENAMPAMKQSRKRVMLRPLPVVPTPSSTTTKIPTKDAFRALDNVKRTEGIAVTKAGDRHCRWPVGDPRSPDFRFCGCQAYEGMPYCIDHARVAYQSVGKKSRAVESDSAPQQSSEFRLPGQTRF
ncbi:MAG TPA: GcrA family cell cycle regulator [Alphaproteobacteria bacterium]|nr:GcrA family cell cycle regulator [Alphaproteobacteria bacterium]